MTRRVFFALCMLMLAGFAGSSPRLLASPPQPGSPPAPSGTVLHGRPDSALNFGDTHIMPTASYRQGLSPAGFDPSPTANMTYHDGPVMPTSTTYAIFWLPAGVHFEPAPQ
ncbi:MAG: hypothetical protein ACR2PL_06400 [Dehalococcoidia bacterium]